MRMLKGLLAACCCEEDRRKIEYIYQHFEKVIFYVIHHRINDQRTAEDLTQDLFVRLIEIADRLDLSDLKKLRSLLIILAKHIAIDYERNLKDAVVDENVSVGMDNNFMENTRTPDDYVLDKEAYERLLISIDKLGDAYTPIFQLRYLHGYSNQEIAELLNIPSAKAVSNRLISGKRILVKMIGGDQYFENKPR